MNKYEELLNAIQTNYGTHSEYYKTVKELVDQTKTPTLEEVKKEWENDQWIWSYDEKDNVIHLWRKYYYVTDHIDINLKYKEIEFNFSKLTIELLERITKTFKALS